MPEFIWELPAVRPEPDDQPSVSDGAIDHAEAAVNRLALQFRKPKIEALVRAYCAPMQALEQALIDVITLRFDITNAVGETLNQLGKLVGQKQVDVTDTTFRSLIRARIRANKSSGMGDQVLLVSRLVLTDYAIQEDVVAAGTMRLRLRNYGHASFVIAVEDMDVPWDLAELLAVDFLRTIAGTGINTRLDFVVQDGLYLDRYARAFRYGSVTDESVGVGGYGSVTTAAYVDPTIIKNGGLSAFDAGASSEQTISGDGYVETTVDEVNTYRAIGLSVDDPGVDRDAIDFALYLRGDGQYAWFSNGANAILGAYAAADVFRVERVGTVVTIVKNDVVVHTFASSSVGDLMIAVTPWSTPATSTWATLAEIVLVDDGVQKAITWQNLVNVEVLAAVGGEMGAAIG